MFALSAGVTVRKTPLVKLTRGVFVTAFACGQVGQENLPGQRNPCRLILICLANIRAIFRRLNALNIGNKNSTTLKFYLNNIYYNNVDKGIVDNSEVPIT